ncbi:MAG: TrkA family potassium uptake protein [Patescibacteria group bacterium]|nr:TrkA family potassium uptake protein [Patescibacteria group bacterium]
MKSNKTLRNLFIALTGIVLIGTLGYWLMEGGSLWSAFFTTVIIMLSHWKHGENDSLAEQLMLIFLILGSFLILAYIFRLAADYIMGGEFIETQRRKKMEKKVGNLKDHYIVCGFGRVGKQVCEDLKHADVDFVVIDRDNRETKIAQELGYLIVNEDPTIEESLKMVNISSAKALISCLGQDTDNLFVTLTARSMSPNLYIVARANDDINTSKFEKAGANRVAIPYQIGGYHMATMALRPAVLDFLDVIVDSRHQELEVEEIEIPHNSFMIGKKIQEELSRTRTGVTVLAVNKQDGSSKVNPGGDEIIHGEDKLIIMGNRSQLDKVTELVK